MRIGIKQTEDQTHNRTEDVRSLWVHPAIALGAPLLLAVIVFRVGDMAATKVREMPIKSLPTATSDMTMQDLKLSTIYAISNKSQIKIADGDMNAVFNVPELPSAPPPEAPPPPDPEATLIQQMQKSISISAIAEGGVFMSGIFYPFGSEINGVSSELLSKPPILAGIKEGHVLVSTSMRPSDKGVKGKKQEAVTKIYQFPLSNVAASGAI